LVVKKKTILPAFVLF